MMLAKILKTKPVDHLGFNISLQHLGVTLDEVSFSGKIYAEQYLSPPGLSIELCSGSRKWVFPCDSREDSFILKGQVPTKDLAIDVSFAICFNNIKCLWLQLRLDLTELDHVTRWSSYFSGYMHLMPDLNPGRLAKQILNSAEIVHASVPSGKCSLFCEKVRSLDFVVRLARLRRQGRFPAIITEEDGVVLGSKLISAWNVLMIQDSGQRLFVFQGYQLRCSIYTRFKSINHCLSYNNPTNFAMSSRVVSHA